MGRGCEAHSLHNLQSLLNYLLSVEVISRLSRQLLENCLDLSIESTQHLHAHTQTYIHTNLDTHLPSIGNDSQASDASRLKQTTVSQISTLTVPHTFFIAPLAISLARECALDRTDPLVSMATTW